jgi:hypothetical protein
MALLNIAKQGNRLETLKELRNKLCFAIDKCKVARDLAPISNQLKDILFEIETLEKIKQSEKEQKEKPKSTLDEVALYRKNKEQKLKQNATNNKSRANRKGSAKLRNIKRI